MYTTTLSAKHSEHSICDFLQALMDYGTVMLLEDTPNIKVSEVESWTVGIG